MGDAKALPPKGLDSIVSRRRVPGRVADEGELTPKVLEVPWDKDALRPFAPPWWASLFWVGGLSGEFISLKAY